MTAHFLCIDQLPPLVDQHQLLHRHLLSHRCDPWISGILLQLFGRFRLFFSE